MDAPQFDALAARFQSRFQRPAPPWQRAYVEEMLPFAMRAGGDAWVQIAGALDARAAARLNQARDKALRHASLHLDYDVLNAHKWYPLLELNWFAYTGHGKETDLTFEGGDLINFGARNAGEPNYLSLAPGFRYQFNPHFQAGAAVEFPLTRKDLMLTRLTVDFILRY